MQNDYYHIPLSCTFPVAQMVKNLAATWETQVQFLGWEDPLEKGMATHSHIVGWESPWTEEPEGLQSIGLQRDMTEQLTPLSYHVIIISLLFLW